VTGRVLWFTGLSGAGKSTIAALVRAELARSGVACFTVDGDVVRAGLSRDLGFSAADRTENVRRIAEIARIGADDGLCVLVSCMSPLRADRESARALVGGARFHEVHVHASIDAVRSRDPKGLYRRFDAGTVANVSGIDSPYEEPAEPALFLDTTVQSAEESAEQVMKFVESTGR
jgi:adenylyl-sulfate kinase